MTGTESEVDTVPPRSRVAIWVVVPLAVTMGLFLILLATRDPSTTRVTQSRLIGGVAPAITGTTIDGSQFDLDNERGRWVVVNFFSTTCVPCQLEHPELVEFQNAHDPAGDATIVSVAFDDSSDNVRRFFERNGGNWPVLAADTGTYAVSYGVAQVPESYLIAPSGLVVDKLIGGIKQQDLESRIAVLEQAAADARASAANGGG